MALLHGRVAADVHLHLRPILLRAANCGQDGIREGRKLRARSVHPLPAIGLGELLGVRIGSVIFGNGCHVHRGNRCRTEQSCLGVHSDGRWSSPAPNGRWCSVFGTRHDVCKERAPAYWGRIERTAHGNHVEAREQRCHIFLPALAGWKGAVGGHRGEGAKGSPSPTISMRMYL